MRFLPFLLSILVFIISHQQINCQENYFDVNPDILEHLNDSYILDINHDFVDDFNIMIEFDDLFQIATARVIGLNGGEIYFDPANDMAGILNLLDTVNSEFNWSISAILANNDPDGNWWFMEDKFLGIRIPQDKEYFYGWIRLNGPTENSPLGFTILIKDAALNIATGESAIAGWSSQYAACNIFVEDVGDLFNANDLHVTFDQALTESSVEEYRVIIVKSTNAPLFNLEDALELPDELFVSIDPVNQGTYSPMFNENTLDSDGEVIVNLRPYQVFVLSLIDIPQQGFLSNASAVITLTTPAPSVSEIIGEDIGNWGDGRDLRVRFNKIVDESLIQEYRVFIVSYAEAEYFTLEEAANLSDDFYTVVAPTGSDPEIILSQEDLTISGSGIHSGGYKIFVMTVPDYIHTDAPGFVESEFITGLVKPDDQLILAGHIREETIYHDSVITVGVLPPEGGESEYIDLNFDGITDISIHAYCWSSMMFYGEESYISAENNAQVIALPLLPNTPISENSLWTTSSGEEYYGPDTGYGGLWYENPGNFLGVLIPTSENDTSYAWVTVSSSSGHKSINNWAYLNLTGNSIYPEYYHYMKVFPVPARQKIYVSFPGQYTKEGVIEIYDLTGRCLTSLTTTIKDQQGSSIDISQMETGIYILKASFKDNQVYSSKIIVQ